MNSSKDITIGGHRGFGETDRFGLSEEEAAKPAENTLPSIEQAITSGATFIELDAVLSRDGVVMFTHNNALASHILSAPHQPEGLNLVNRPYVSQYDAAELQQLRTGPQGNGIIPTLAEVLAPFADHPLVRLNIEIKGRQDTLDQTPPPENGATLVEAIIDALRQSPLPPSQILLSSFAASYLAEAKAVAPEFPRAMIFTTPQSGFAHKPVLPHKPEDHSLYECFTPERIIALHQQLALHSLHPEITSLHEGLFNTISPLRREDGQPLAIYGWALLEPSPETRKNLLRQAVSSARQHQIPLGFITNHIPAMQAVLR